MISACFLCCSCRAVGHMAGVWEVSPYCAHIYMMVMHLQNISSVCVCLSFWQRTAGLGVCHVVPAGCSSHIGEDRWTTFSFPMVYNADWQRGNKEPETRRYTVRFNHWNGEEKSTLTKRNLAASKLRRHQKLEVLRDDAVPATSSPWRGTEIDFSLVSPHWERWKHGTLEKKWNPGIHGVRLMSMHIRGLWYVLYIELQSN